MIKSSVLVCFLTSKKRLTCVPMILLRKLPKYGKKGKTLAWFKSYLKDHIQIVDINGNLSLEKTFNISVIQGILSPILFLIYINDLYSVTDLLTLMFADDTASVGSDKNIRSSRKPRVVLLNIKKIVYIHITVP